MGLDTSHNCWHGPYSAFMRWRTEIAKQIGIPLQMMEGFYDWQKITQEDRDKLGSLIMNKDGTHAEWATELLRAAVEQLPLRWDAFKPSPLHKLLNHSDCEGEIAWEDCDAIAYALVALLPTLPDSGTPWGMVGITKQFIAGLRDAASKKENVDFH